MRTICNEGVKVFDADEENSVIEYTLSDLIRDGYIITGTLKTKDKLFVYYGSKDD